MSFQDLFLGIVIGALFYALVIWIVGKLGLGLEIRSFGAAFIAAIVIAVVGWAVFWMLSILGFSIDIGGSTLGAIVLLPIAAVVLMIAGMIVKGLTVKGCMGAFVAAIAIAVVTWLLRWVLSLI